MFYCWFIGLDLYNPSGPKGPISVDTQASLGIYLGTQNTVYFGSRFIGYTD